MECKGDCDNYGKYDSALSSTYVEDGRFFSQSYEDGSVAKGKPKRYSYNTVCTYGSATSICTS